MILLTHGTKDQFLCNYLKSSELLFQILILLVLRYY